jgi:division protein CdvB (Snf7/Vps24/ESCRT-III family)
MTLLLSAVLLFFPPPPNLADVRSEANLERRAELALDNAHTAIDRAREFAKAGEYDKLHQQVIEVQESVELCQESLEAAGKDPRKNVRQFKKVEMRIHQLTRRMKGFADEVSIEDKPAIEKVANRLDEINDEIVGDMFGRKKKK